MSEQEQLAKGLSSAVADAGRVKDWVRLEMFMNEIRELAEGLIDNVDVQEQVTTALNHAVTATGDRVPWPFRPRR